MKLPGCLLLGWLISLQMCAREIDLRIWIAGGTQDLVLGSRECPGWLSVARQLELEDPDACWIHLGTPPVEAEKLQIPGLQVPNVLIPGEEDFRLQGREGLGERAFPMLNLTVLPQFPEQQSGFELWKTWQSEDGPAVQVTGLMSASAPLRIPADRLRPLQVLPPVEALREHLTENPFSENDIPVLVLPEDADGAEWSQLFPDLPVLVLPPSKQAGVVEVNQGRQLRVQPGLYGRSLIRIQLYWDTVSRSFSKPTAEVVWVKAPDFQGVELPDDFQIRLRPWLIDPQVLPLASQLLDQADAALLPEQPPLPIDSSLPDALRLKHLPENQAWLKVTLSRSRWRQWQQSEPAQLVLENEDLPDPLTVLITGKTAAGNGDWHSIIRQDLLKENLQKTWLPHTGRELILPLEIPDEHVQEK